MKSAIIAKL